MTLPLRKTAEVIPLRPQARKRLSEGVANPAPPGRISPARKLLLFLMGSALLHGVVLLVSPAAHVEQRAESPEILLVRLSEVPQVAERLAEPQPPSQREEPRPAAPTPPPRKRPLPRVEAPQPEASPHPEPVPAEQRAEPPQSQAPVEVAGASDKTPVQEAPQTARGAPALTPPVFSAAYLRNPPPEYPLAARRRGQEGLVLLAVRVNESGSPVEVRIARSSGSGVLDDAALAAVERWSFVPARRGDQAIAAWVEVPVRFRLKDR